jgi:Tfp pilus assembly protein FimT
MHRFTLRERLAILSIIFLMAVVVFANYVHGSRVRSASHQSGQALNLAREAVNRETCKVIGNAAESYRQDKGRSPQSVDDLIRSGYLIALPPEFKQEDCKW